VLVLRPVRPLGFASNHNIAFERASGEYFCVLNPDVIFQGSVLPALVALIERGQGHIVAPIMRDSRGRLEDSFRELPSPMRLIRRRLGRRQPPPLPAAGALLHPDWIAGTFMLMQRATFSQLKGFDQRYRLYLDGLLYRPGSGPDHHC
jgi:GT2 family glycosyltransferase